MPLKVQQLSYHGLDTTVKDSFWNFIAYVIYLFTEIKLRPTPVPQEHVYYCAHINRIQVPTTGFSASWVPCWIPRQVLIPRTTERSALGQLCSRPPSRCCTWSMEVLVSLGCTRDGHMSTHWLDQIQRWCPGAKWSNFIELIRLSVGTPPLHDTLLSGTSSVAAGYGPREPAKKK